MPLAPPLESVLVQVVRLECWLLRAQSLLLPDSSAQVVQFSAQEQEVLQRLTYRMGKHALLQEVVRSAAVQEL